ncbi:MAG: maleylpyruvate isomerase family mycothiol-dependent enzyme [Actinobacteria bacterium]|nr:maleylpyruvate isomerase family mycothiol-dependent enzyme [Actinomycetota bacterium]
MNIDYTAHLRADGELMAEAASRDLEAHVPTCPDWNVAKLVIHTGQHHRWVADAVKGGGAPPPNPPKPGLRGGKLIEWFRQGWRELADLLDETGDDTVAWSWSGDNRVGFWRRRTALETLVHRWDAENATGTGSPLDPEIAGDGVDEVFFVMLGDDAPYHGSNGALEAKTNDVPGAWILALEDGKTPKASRSNGSGSSQPASCTITAPASDLLLFVWGRLGPEVLTVEGDRSLFHDFVTWGQ